jgi:hypothetical protein
VTCRGLTRRAGKHRDKVHEYWRMQEFGSCGLAQLALSKEGTDVGTGILGYLRRVGRPALLDRHHPCS